MGRKLQDAHLGSRDARRKLKQRQEPYWRLITEGCHVGYYRGARVGKWVARYRKPGTGSGYAKTTLGEADDVHDADGVSILTFEQADAAARAWHDRMKGGAKSRDKYTVGDALDDYLAGFEGRSLEATRNRIEVLIRPELGSVKLAELTTERIKRWHRDRANTAARLRTARDAQHHQYRPLETDEAKRRRRSTANRDLTVLKAALNKAWRDGMAANDEAWRKVKPFEGVEDARRRYLTDDESRRLVNAAAPAVRPLIQAALLTGARYGELTAARVADVDLQAKAVTFRETKGGAPRTVYLEAEGLALFEQQCAGKAGSEFVFLRPDGGKWRAAQQGRPMREACEHAKINPPASFHDLRRTFGARLARRGVPMAVIREALGHADERITLKHYAHLAPSYVSETVRENVAGLGIVERGNVHSIELAQRKEGKAAEQPIGAPKKTRKA